MVAGERDFAKKCLEKNGEKIKKEREPFSLYMSPPLAGVVLSLNTVSEYSFGYDHNNGSET